MLWNSDIFKSSLEELREEPPPKKRKITHARMMERWYTSEQTLQSWPDNIGKRIPAPSNDWALTIVLSLTGKNFSALVSACSYKSHGLETPERLGVKFIGARPVVNMLKLTILISISTLCPQCRVQRC